MFVWISILFTLGICMSPDLSILCVFFFSCVYLLRLAITLCGMIAVCRTQKIWILTQNLSRLKIKPWKHVVDVIVFFFLLYVPLKVFFVVCGVIYMF